MPLVDIQNVSRSYGHIVALRDVSLRLEEGAIGLVGNNGAGKSTLLKVLLGLLRPDSGAGTILGCDIFRATHDLRGQVGYMPEAAATVPLLKGVEFVALAGSLYGMRRHDAQQRAHEVLDYCGLGELRYRRLEEYSTGNAQRLKLAAALVHDPRLLLLDEPTNGLDPLGRQDMLKLISDLIAETGKSVILCTHLLGDVEKLCKQVVVLHQGAVISSGPTQALRARVRDCYELAWRGEEQTFLAALEHAGCSVERNGAMGRYRTQVPQDWTAARLFQLAQQHGVVITHWKADEENLERLFFRLTDGQTPVASSHSASFADPTNGEGPAEHNGKPAAAHDQQTAISGGGEESRQF